MAHRQSPKPSFNAQALVSKLQSQLDSDGALRAELAADLADIDAGSNSHLEELLGVATDIEDEINDLISDLAIAKSAMEVYNIAAGTNSAESISLSETTYVFLALFPNWREWDQKFNTLFQRLHSMKRRLAH